MSAEFLLPQDTKTKAKANATERNLTAACNANMQAAYDQSVRQSVSLILHTKRPSSAGEHNK